MNPARDGRIIQKQYLQTECRNRPKRLYTIINLDRLFVWSLKPFLGKLDTKIQCYMILNSDQFKPPLKKYVVFNFNEE
jgi:hypothetical protein